jgi:succinyl-diaminopimelate desuccinylase
MTAFSFKGVADYNEISKLLADLVSIDSVNPGYPGCRNGEKEISEYVYNYCKKIGIDCILDEVLPGRSNVVCFINGKDRRGLCLESHMDTVSIKHMDIDPLNPIIKDGRMYGRGSSDDKGSLAAMMIAIKNILKHNIKPSTDLYFVASVDEEYQHRGVDHFLKKGIKLQGAVVGEPTQLDIVTACKGVVRWKITSIGKAGHSSRPDKGHNAIYDMVDFIEIMKNELIASLQNKKHPLLGSPSLSVGCINGGSAVNIIPDQCTIEVDRRLLPGETSETAKNEILDLIAQLKKDGEIDINVSEPTTYAMPVDTDNHQIIVKTAISSCTKIIGSSAIKGVDFGCDASSFTETGIPSIVFGPGSILQAHTKDEFICLEEVCKASEIYSQICIDF